MITVVTLTACFNRRNLTVSALSSLFSQTLPTDVSVQHVVVDDCSTDGTLQAINEMFPSVEVVEGTGKLYWAGAMLHGWKQVIQHCNYDYLFVYNDDASFFPDALANLLRTSFSIADQENFNGHLIAGSFLDSSKQFLTYGGLKKSSFWHPLRFSRVKPDLLHPVLLDTINMNGCLISRSAIDRVGFLSEYFIHHGADYEYGLKLRRHGGVVLLAPGFIGICDLNLPLDINSLPYIKRCKYLLGPKGEPIMQRLKYCFRYGGFFWPFIFILPYLRLLRL
jgi:GT2 family glycosyltransferase